MSDTFFYLWLISIVCIGFLIVIGCLQLVGIAKDYYTTTKTTPNIILENPVQCQINCSQCLEYCNTIIDDALQTYIKVKGIGTTIAIREGYK